MKINVHITLEELKAFTEGHNAEGWLNKQRYIEENKYSSIQPVLYKVIVEDTEIMTIRYSGKVILEGSIIKDTFSKKS